jgi:hypothetical protein
VEAIDLEHYVARSGALDLTGIDWDDVPRHPLSADALRTLRYMQDIESHTIVYLRTLLATRAIDDPDVATFFSCWFYEETFHGRALAQFLRAAGHEPVARERSKVGWGDRIEAVAVSALSRLWPDFVAVHMTWGAINELTTLTGYRRLAELSGHPVLADILVRIIRDESRHFQFYYQQAARRLARPAVARVVRSLVERLWAPVGSGVQPAEETRFLASYLLSGSEGRAAARKIDGAIQRLPGLQGLRLVEHWMDSQPLSVGASPTPVVLAT